MCLGYEVIRWCKKGLEKGKGDASKVGKDTHSYCAKHASEGVLARSLAEMWVSRTVGLGASEWPEWVKASAWKAESCGWLTDWWAYVAAVDSSTPQSKQVAYWASLDCCAGVTSIFIGVVLARGKPALWKDHLSSPFDMWHITNTL